MFQMAAGREWQNREKIGDVMIGGGLADDTSNRVLDRSEIGLLGEAREERVAIVHTGGGKAVDKDGDGVGSEGGAEPVDATIG